MYSVCVTDMECSNTKLRCDYAERQTKSLRFTSNSFCTDIQREERLFKEFHIFENEYWWLFFVLLFALVSIQTKHVNKQNQNDFRKTNLYG